MSTLVSVIEPNDTSFNVSDPSTLTDSQHFSVKIKGIAVEKIEQEFDVTLIKVLVRMTFLLYS